MTNYFGTKQLLDLYRNGVFPMADNRDDPRLFIIDPEIRGVFDLNNFHIPKRLKRTVASQIYQISADYCFERIIKACALEGPKRKDTWINDEIIKLYCQLHLEGHAHSIEVWDQSELVGGLYGVSLGGAFFGESMFSTRPDASKIALVHLVAALKYANYQLLDAQYHNNHLAQFGLKEIMRAKFQILLSNALKIECKFPSAHFSKPPIAVSPFHHLQGQQVAARLQEQDSQKVTAAPLPAQEFLNSLSSGQYCLTLI